MLESMAVLFTPGAPCGGLGAAKLGSSPASYSQGIPYLGYFLSKYFFLPTLAITTTRGVCMWESPQGLFHMHTPFAMVRGSGLVQGVHAVDETLAHEVQELGAAVFLALAHFLEGAVDVSQLHPEKCLQLLGDLT